MTVNLKHLRLAALMLMTAFTLTAAAADETINDQVSRQKEIDNGGSGRYKAIVVSEKTLPNFTVYRPRNIKYAARREGPLPILIWCNGACSGSSTSYERLLNHIASHGYVVVGIGAFEMTDDERDDGGSDEKMVVEAYNWLARQEKLTTSDYFHAINVKNVALAGHSCGGAQAIANCSKSWVKTLLIMNAGMGGMSMGGASPSTLNSLHCPLIYMTGGTGDVAYENAKTDYGKVKKPVAWADLSDAGHNPGYWEQYGGRFGTIAIKWMDWQLKGYKQNARIFLKPDLTGFDSHWTVKTRNFTAADKDYDAPFKDMETETDTVFDRAALDSTFVFGADVSSTTQITRQSKKFYNRAGQQKSLMAALKEQGANSVRLRVLVSPSNNDFNTAYAKTLGNQAKTQGLSIMLDMHYCDWWGDNVKPKGWKNYNSEKLLNVVKSHTNTVVRSLNGTGYLRWVQIGNEVDGGLLWEDGRETATFVSIINTAYEAVKAVNPELQTVLHVAECENTKWLTDYFDTLQVAGAQWDAIGLSMHVKGSTLKPEALTAKVCENVKVLRERYGKPVFIVETGYYNDRQIEGNQWLCDLLMQLMDAGAAGLYYWEPEMADDYDMGAWNPLTRKPSLSMDAFLGVKHYEPGTAVRGLSMIVSGGQTEYYTPGGMRIAHPQRGLNIVRQRQDGNVRTYKIFR